MTPPVSIAPPEALDADEFELDMRFVEAATPLVIMMCDTDDTCGSTCGTTACNSSSNDPF
jgi:FxLD family lantipeptide